MDSKSRLWKQSNFQLIWNLYVWGNRDVRWLFKSMVLLLISTIIQNFNNDDKFKQPQLIIISHTAQTATSSDRLNLYNYCNWDICLFLLPFYIGDGVSACRFSVSSGCLYFASLVSFYWVYLCLNEECASNPDQERVHLEWASQTSLRL